ncbi:glycosyltransferase family 2 protein [Synechococcus sp. CCY 9618]|uniref:glycosyltransferase family 2 protein n=1 Tax=Synechococcus sp. CCY 9618 TaxID=2815602 RepID=UPI001C219167|nr:glycosyltransferase family 2 protein [Synechococcus sp. CCY 9618]
MKRPGTSPLVSVIVPNFEHAPFLRERLRSILEQSFQDFELIVLDDASQDDSLQVIRDTLRDHPHRLIRNPVNSGQPCSQWLNGLRHATGRYAWIAESDDTCSPLFLERLVRALEEGCVLAYCRTTSINTQGDPFSTDFFWPDTFDPVRWRSPFTLGGADLCRAYMARGNVIANASSVVFRKPDDSLLAALEQAVAGRRCTGDWLFWTLYLMRMGGSVDFESEALSSFRFHEGTTRSIASRQKETGRFGEYSTAIATILRITRPSPRWHWFEVATSGDWDWLLNEYLLQYRPSLSEKLFLLIVHGPLRLGLYVRLLQCPALRRRYLRWPTA